MRGLMLLIFFIAIIASCRSQDNVFRRTGLSSDDFVPHLKVSSGDSSQYSNHNNEGYDCVCFDKSQIPVSEALGKTATNLKRLVVYLYKDTNTNNLQLYTPNKEKQAQFPDLGIDEGDLHKISFETVDQVFNTNTNAVDVKKPSSFDPLSETILKDEVVSSVPNNENHVEEHEETVGGAPPIASLQIKAVPIKSINSENSIKNEDASKSEVDPDSKETKNTFINSDNSGNADTNPKTQGSPQHEYNIIYGGTSALENQGLPVVILPPGEVQSENLSEFNKEKSTNDRATENDSGSTSGTPPSSDDVDFELNNLSPYKYETNDVPYFQNVESGDTSNYNQNQNTEPKPDSKHSLHTIAVENYNQPENTEVTNSVANKKERNNRNEYLTFDLWFSEQMKKIRKTGKAPNKKIDLSSLKHLIEKTLFDNGLYVTKDGVLTDSKANALDVSNLKLRPILIGDSLTYDNFFGENNAAKYELPSNLPYLESVLVTSIKPPKILGVIPIRKTFVPRVSYRTGLDYWDWREKNHFGDCKTWQCILNKLNSDKFKQHYNVHHSHGHKKHLVKLTRKTGKTVHQFVNPLKGTSNPKLVNQVMTQFTNPKDKSGKYNYRLNLKNVLQAFQSTLFKTPKNNRDHYVPKAVKSEPRRSDYEVIFEEEPTEDDDESLELPGFRIIGGMPATSSGTPVSSKGRAGFTHY